MHSSPSRSRQRRHLQCHRARPADDRLSHDHHERCGARGRIIERQGADDRATRRGLRSRSARKKTVTPTFSSFIDLKINNRAALRRGSSRRMLDQQDGGLTPPGPPHTHGVERRGARASAMMKNAASCKASITCAFSNRPGRSERVSFIVS
jgi:hypothetical protein